MTIVFISIAKYSSIINVEEAQNVKNTMIDKILTHIAPHHCCGCDEIGSLLCSSCRNDIAYDRFAACAVCTKAPADATGMCSSCHPPYQRIWVAGSLSGVLERVIGEMKLGGAREGVEVAAQLLAEILPTLPKSAVIVPIPTIRPHVRERGFDHTKLLARRLAKLKQVRCTTSLLMRRTSSVQRGATAVQRRAQAKDAFRLNDTADGQTTYLLIDDVMTTGATLHHAAQLLRDGGAGEVWVVATARQVLE